MITLTTSAGRPADFPGRPAAPKFVSRHQHRPRAGQVTVAQLLARSNSGPAHQRGGWERTGWLRFGLRQRSEELRRGRWDRAGLVCDAVSQSLTAAAFVVLPVAFVVVSVGGVR